MKRKETARPIIIRRSRRADHVHHGGSWKVAYADFVTAMMAFFLVMWILGMDEKTRKAIEGYFANPAGYMKEYGAGHNAVAVGSTPEQMIGRPVFDFVFEENRALVRQHFREFLQQPAGKLVEERLKVREVLDGGGRDSKPNI